MNVTSLPVNITSLSLTLISDNSPAPSGPAPTIGANASQDRVSLSSLLANLQHVSATVAQQSTGKETISLNALTYDFRQAFQNSASNGQSIQGHHNRHHGHHQADYGSRQAPSLNVSDVQHALDELTTTLRQQADSDGTVSKAMVRQDVDQLFSTLRGESDTRTSTVQTVA